MDATGELAFLVFVHSRSGALLRSAYLLTGDRQHAEDLVQTALAKTASDLKPAVQEALSRLGPRQRTVVVLRFFEDRTERETAEILGGSIGTRGDRSRRGARPSTIWSG